MKPRSLLLASCLVLVPCGPSEAQTPVLVMDSGVQTVTIGPGAPAHTIGLQGHRQTITLDTGAQAFALRYVVARDPKDPKAAIPGEGYVGMSQPVDCNWYAGGFFDVLLNGRSIGGTLAHSVCGRSSPGRGTADFVFDAPQAVARVRFVAQSGGDCLFAQLLLEPKEEIKSVRVSVRCYPSAFVSDADRRVATAARELKQGERAELDAAGEWWTLYYDGVYDAGYVSPTHRGAGPCAVLWAPGQTVKAGFTVGAYGTDTAFDLKPPLGDFRFVFFDFAGTKNEAAKAAMRARADALRNELAAFKFTDPGVADWPLREKQAEAARALASLPDDKDAAARYERWGRELAARLDRVRSGAAGSIMAEAEAARTIGEWERGLPELKLRALLKEI